MKMTNDGKRMTNQTDKGTQRGVRFLRARSGHGPSASSFSSGRLFNRRSVRGFSLIEILIAMFVFLVGVMGVLSIFPVAMSNAGRSVGEVRATILGQNVISQITADTQAEYEKGLCAFNSGQANGLKRKISASTDMTGHFISLTSGPGRGQSRIIWQDDLTTMTVVPDWTQVIDGAKTWTGPGDPEFAADTDSYIITRLGLPWDGAVTDSRLRSRYVRRIDGNSIYAGVENLTTTPPRVDAYNWPSIWTLPAPPVGYGASGGSASSVACSSASWSDHDPALRGNLVTITVDGTVNGPAVGQVRWITDNIGSTLYVWPDWDGEPDNWNLASVEVRSAPGYFLVVTSGRASGRIFPITGFATDADGDKITCAGAKFSSIGVKAALDKDGAPLSNADSFLVIGSSTAGGGLTTMLTAFPVVDTRNYVFNSFGRRNTIERQVGQDIFKRDAAEKEASDFDFVAVLSAPDVQGGPVRADVFVFRNYDSARTPDKNQRAVGYMTGYIGRPKP